jgi:transcription elongation GreA/GreB family factor
MTKLVQELEDIINVQIPENGKAIAHARSYGDFRENAEYDAAKERRRFLHRRRAELESTVGSVQTTDFKNIEVKDTVVLGSAVTLASANGTDSVYYILGAWDGDPDRNRISYRTVMGEALLEKKVGSSVKLPNGEFTIKAISVLPADLVKELADEGGNH